MPKSYKIDKLSINTRIDKWLKNNIGKLPQSLIEKDLRRGNIKLNDKKVKSSTKLKLGDEVKLYKPNYKLYKIKSNQKFIPTKKIINFNESLIIEDNKDFIVLNKQRVYLYKAEQNLKII